MTWSFISYVAEVGQSGGAFAFPSPAGIQDGDLLVLGVAASAVGFGLLGLETTSGFTAGPSTSEALAPAIAFQTAAKVAASEPATYSANEGTGSTFMASILAAYRWSGGAADISDLSAYRGTVGSVHDTVNPLTITAGAYNTVATDDLALYWLIGRQANNGHPAVAPAATLATDASAAYDDFHTSLVLASEVVNGNIPARDSTVDFTGGGASCSGIAARLAREASLSSAAPGFGFGNDPFGGMI